MLFCVVLGFATSTWTIICGSFGVRPICELLRCKWGGGNPHPLGCRLLKVGRLREAGASDERKGVRGWRKALSRKILTGGRGARGLYIVFILVCIGLHNEDTETRGRGFENGILARLTIAPEHQVA